MLNYFVFYEFTDKIIRDAGVGTFGRVIECYDKKLRENIALKVVRKVPKYTDGALVEAKILERINRLTAKHRRNNLCVKMHSSFKYRGYLCISFEKVRIR